MTNYYTQTQYVSNSALTELKYILSGQPLRDLREAYRFGSLLDAVITDPGAIDSIPHTQEELNICIAMRASFLSDPFGKYLHSSFNKQKEIYNDALSFTHEGITFTLPFKGRFDFERSPIIADLKSTACKTQKAFEQSCDQFDYDRQSAAYLKLSGASQFMLIGVSKSKPYPVFKVPIQKGDARWISGNQKLNDLAFKKWML